MHQAEDVMHPPPGADLEAEYNNRARVPGHMAVMRAWADAAADFRAPHPPEVIAYGSGEREAMDLFTPPGGRSGATVMFIHGGYWQALDRSWFSHLARGLNAHGVALAIPSYDLCPGVRIGDILEQMRAACAVLHGRTSGRIIASGHSAGGHLSACLLATDWAGRGLPKALVPAAYSISGLFDLKPLVPTSLNTALRLDAAEAEALSPVRWPAPADLVLDAVFGAAESEEFVRQSRMIAEVWGGAGVATRYEAIEAADHFTVLAPFADPASPQVARLVELAMANG